MNQIKDPPLVSIIMPSYNSSLYIEDSIQSIINQTFKNWELLITDDCSTDNTLNILNHFKEYDTRIKVFQLMQNGGAGIARNNSIEKANGRFIAFCDSDDCWYPEKLEKQICFMLENKIALSYSDYEIINDNGEKIAIFHSPSKITYNDMIKNDDIGCLTAIYDTQDIGKQFMPSIRKRQDWALWLNILKLIPHASGLQETLAIYRKRESSISSNKSKLIKYIWNVYRKEEKMPFLLSVYQTAAYFYYYWRKINQRIEKV